MHLTFVVPEEEEESKGVNLCVLPGWDTTLTRTDQDRLRPGIFEEATYAVYTSRTSTTVSHPGRPHTWYLTLHEQQNVTKP